MDPHDYDIEKETAANRNMLEERIPVRLNDIYRLLVENRQGFEPWRLALTIDLVQSIERNCREMLETHGRPWTCLPEAHSNPLMNL